MQALEILKTRMRGPAGLSAGLLFLVLLVIGNADPARACACCADAGYRFDMTSELEPYDREVLQAVRFAGKAALASREFDVEGLPLPSYDDSEEFYGFELETVFAADRWTFKLSDNGTQQGTIVFAMPKDLDEFFVDPRDGSQHSGAGGPVLYKEWRLMGPAVLNGKTTAPASLILHGRGNACSSEADFSHWTLNVDGGGVRFMLIGDLVR